MSDRSFEEPAEDAPPFAGPRATPRAGYVRALGQDIQQAAYQRIGRTPGPPFEEMVIQLRKLVYLLRRTLVPVCASQTFLRALGRDIRSSAQAANSMRQQRVRWLMVGGMVGSALSLLGVLAALLMRRKNGRVHAKKPIGVS